MKEGGRTTNERSNNTFIKLGTTMIIVFPTIGENRNEYWTNVSKPNSELWGDINKNNPVISVYFVPNACPYAKLPAGLPAE